MQEEECSEYVEKECSTEYTEQCQESYEDQCHTVQVTICVIVMVLHAEASIINLFLHLPASRQVLDRSYSVFGESLCSCCRMRSAGSSPGTSARPSTTKSAGSRSSSSKIIASKPTSKNNTVVTLYFCFILVLSLI